MAKKGKTTRGEMIEVIIRAAIRKFKVFKANGGNKTEAVIAVATVMNIQSCVRGLCLQYNYQPPTKTEAELVDLYANTFNMLAAELL